MKIWVNLQVLFVAFFTCNFIITIYAKIIYKSMKGENIHEKRSLSTLLVLALVITMIPAAAVTADASTYTGTIGGVNYSVDTSTGVITFTKGEGTDDYEADEMEDFRYYTGNYRVGYGFHL